MQVARSRCSYFRQPHSTHNPGAVADNLGPITGRIAGVPQVEAFNCHCPALRFNKQSTQSKCSAGISDTDTAVIEILDGIRRSGVPVTRLLICKVMG